MSNNRPFSMLRDDQVVLSWHPMTGLKEITVGLVKQEDIPCGTVIRFGDHTFAPWKVRVKRRVSGRTWKQMSVQDLSKRLKTEAMLMNIQIERPPLQPMWTTPPVSYQRLLNFPNHSIYLPPQGHLSP